ncbi:MAG: CPBP family intramembrane metalloprotease [Candidatus Micrarchaeota archaeon]|nr:CPBP family intramembrane metalloprotease [Candidatus Micrarchaeota archaeon]MDE1804831.1 CPBP family intramembrane metalloprotease [Candidatus Micrarchaeota archaeon]MDE1847146.1 CPBP family intramembrane metalloprotease [Candidatus Micrarchaeota archaeon]
MNTLQRRSDGQRSLKAAVYAFLFLLLVSYPLVVYLFKLGAISENGANDILTALLSFFFPAIAFSYMLRRGIAPRDLISAVGLGRRSLRPMLLGIGVMIFLTVFVLTLFVSVASSVTNVSINTNAGLLINSAPLWFIILTMFIGPLDEEIFFRGFLVPRLGPLVCGILGGIFLGNRFKGSWLQRNQYGVSIVLSAFLFALPHLAYGSTLGIDAIAAFIFGLIAGYVYRKTNSLYPSYIAHVLNNSLAVLALGGM